jgi:DNA repair protein RadA/Sms
LQKSKNLFICSDCNYQALKWLGCCPECNAWGTLDEHKIAPKVTASGKGVSSYATTTSMPLVRLHDIKIITNDRMLTGIDEWDRIVGGGIMPHSLIVLTGDPGIGKSTLLLEVSQRLSNGYSVLYVSTEESLTQVRQRADRLECVFGNNITFSDCADLELIIETVQQHKPEVLIIDSIQNCYLQGATSLPGSIGQLRDATFRLMRLAKEGGVTIILTGHINKEGLIAGPKTMEHMVDAVFYLQGEDRWQTRILRAVKNRFGTINELGFFEMTAQGMLEVQNINQNLIAELSNSPGSALIAITEGTRPLLLELQALTIASKMTMPQRVISGIDHKQVILIAAILEKYLHVKLSSQDIFFKVSGGLKARGSTTDLGIALALLSSYFQQSLPEKSLAIGEINLTGQVRPVNHINIFVKEAEKFGITTFLVAHNQKLETKHTITKQFTHVYELLTLFDKG